jgi:hypothetical protein
MQDPDTGYFHYAATRKDGISLASIFRAPSRLEVDGVVDLWS